MEYSLYALVLLIADVYAILNIFQSGATTERKLLWTILILLLPLIGFIAWYFAGPKTGRV